jgi:hypothetical protein
MGIDEQRIKEFFMKNLCLSVLLIFLAFSAFPQEKDSRAPFQGIWYGVDGKDKIIYIFIDDVFITNHDDGFSGKLSVDGQNLILAVHRDLYIDEWEDIHSESRIDLFNNPLNQPVIVYDAAN